jgi:uncharacterized membrane protein YgcG
MPAGRPRKLTRVQVAWLQRSARKHERFIAGYEFPPYLWERAQKRLPDLSTKELELVERGLREWFICCAWRWGTVVGMPSRAVDETWHELIVDTREYAGFCTAAFGEYLHHTPDEAMTTPMGDALGETVRAWDRSEAGRGEESVLWDLDARLGIAEPLGIDAGALAAARSRSPYPAAAGWAGAGYGGGCGVGGSGGGEGGGDSGGGGCGGGGCGGGGS